MRWYRMEWIIGLGFLGFCVWRTKRAREQALELAPTGILRSPLYLSANALAVLLLGLVMYMAKINHERPIPAFLWFAVAAIVVILLILRRALKWRYPV